MSDSIEYLRDVAEQERALARHERLRAADYPDQMHEHREHLELAELHERAARRHDCTADIQARAEERSRVLANQLALSRARIFGVARRHGIALAATDD